MFGRSPCGERKRQQTNRRTRQARQFCFVSLICVKKFTKMTLRRILFTATCVILLVSGFSAVLAHYGGYKGYHPRGLKSRGGGGGFGGGGGGGGYGGYGGYSGAGDTGNFGSIYDYPALGFPYANAYGGGIGVGTGYPFYGGYGVGGYGLGEGVPFYGTSLYGIRSLGTPYGYNGYAYVS